MIALHIGLSCQMLQRATKVLIEEGSATRKKTLSFQLSQTFSFFIFLRSSAKLINFLSVVGQMILEFFSTQSKPTLISTPRCLTAILPQTRKTERERERERERLVSNLVINGVSN